jgi:protein-S-isoprenylcysteine O-methyltransferase Ste14
MAVFEYLYLAGMIAAEVIRFPHRMRNKRQRRAHQLAESRVSPLEITVDLLSWTAMEVLPWFFIFGSRLDSANYALPSWAGWLGVLVFAAGLWLIWRAHHDLGFNWSPTLEIQPEHHLVTKGIYGRLRHPIYAGMWLWSIAQILLLWNWIAGPAGLLTFALVYATRVPKEERMMLDQFGDEYRAYQRRTGAIVPKM